MSNELTMDELLAGSEVTALAVGDVVEGVITSVRKMKYGLTSALAV